MGADAARWLEGLDPRDPPRLRWVLRAHPGARRIGVLSAAFNPPTRAHLALAEAARAALELEEVVLLLALTHVEKPLIGFGLSERLEMLQAIACGRAGYSVALCNRPRFFEKAIAFREALGEVDALFFLMGGDTLVRLFDPRYYPDLPLEAALECFFTLAEAAVAPRPPWDRQAMEAFLEDPARARYRPRIHWLALPEALAGISSSEVRDRRQRGEPVDDAVPPEIRPWLGGPL